MAKGILELKVEMAEMKTKNIEIKEKIVKLKEENRALKRKIERILFCFPNTKKLSICRPMPAELLNEMFASLPLKNAFGLLTIMPNGLLARNVRKMLKSVEMATKNNKWNAEDCGPNLIISEDGLVVEHSGPFRWNSIRASLPILFFNLNDKKPSISAYFEVQIVNKHRDCGIDIGFCTQLFPPAEGQYLGDEENSIGIDDKEGMRINGQSKKFAKGDGYFNVGDVIGFGIIHFSANFTMKCFATCNGKLLGTIDLPDNFSTFQLYPAVDMLVRGNLIRANFGQEKWHFNPTQLLK